MKAFVIENQFKTGWKNIEFPQPNAGEVLLKVLYVGLCGSDLNTYRGLNPLVGLPRIPGHEISAVIEKRGCNVPEYWSTGKLVTVSPYTNCGGCPSCLSDRPNCCQFNQTLGVQRDGALTEYITIPWQKLFDASGMKRPEEVALVEPLTVGSHAADRSGAMEDSIAAVIGCGAVGLGAILGLSGKGAREVIAVDVDDEKLNLARQFGATQTINSAKTDLHQAFSKISGEFGPNIIVEAVGLPATYRAAVEEVAFAGGVVYIGYAKAPVEYQTKLFVQKELNIHGSRNADPQNFRRIIHFAEKGKFTPSKMISRIYPFENAGDALHDWNESPSKVCRYLIQVNQ